MKYLIVLILLSGCALTQHLEDKTNAIYAIKVGDSYQHMLDSINDPPNSVKCYTSSNYQTCTAYYRIGNYKSATFRFDHNDILTSVYR